MNSFDVTAFILAGGKSSRMGTDKGLMLFNNNPMISYVIECVKVNFETINIISNNPAYNTFGYPVIEDKIKDIGPIGGILTGLEYSQTPWSFFIACDMPFVTSEVITDLLHKDFNFIEAVIPENNSQIEALCGFYNKNVIEKIKNQIAIGDYKMQNLIGLLNAGFVNFAYLNLRNQNPFENLNSQEDLKKVIVK